MEENIISIGMIVALAKAAAIKYGNIGISNITENDNKNGIVIELSDGSTYTVVFNGMMLKSVYDTDDSGVVDNSQKLDGNLPSYYTTSSNINYDNSTSGTLSTNVKDVIDELVRDINNSMGKIFTLDFEGTLENNIITGRLDDSISAFELEPNTEYIFSLILPIATLTGDLNNDYLMYLQDKDGNNININCIFTRDLMDTSNVREMCSLQSYDAQTGYRWIFKGRYTEITENGELRRNIYTSDVTRETNPSMTGKDLYNSIVNVDIKPGTTILCTEDYRLNGFIFKQGHSYLVRGDWSTGELQVGVVDLTDFFPTTSSIIMGNQASTSISSDGKYIYLGDVDELIIDTIDPVEVNIIGTLGILTLPTTTKTVLINATGYNGAEFNSRPSALQDGSTIGKYRFGGIDLL